MSNNMNIRKKQNKSNITVITSSIIVIIILLIVLKSTQHKLDVANYEISELNDQVEALLKVAYKEESISSSSNTSNDYSDSNSSIQAQITTLSDGSYRVPEDIAAGTYNVTAKEGYGLLTGDFSSGYLSTTIGYDSSTGQTREYKNLRLSNGDEFTIVSGCTMVFTPR